MILECISRYDKISREMIPTLHHQLSSSYGSDPDFTRRWDRLQVESKCCGISGPLDYNSTPAFTSDGGGGVTHNGHVVAALIADSSSFSSAEQNDGVAAGDLSEDGFTTFFVPATCCHPSQALPMQLTLNANTKSEETNGATPTLSGPTPASLVFDNARAERSEEFERRRAAIASYASPHLRYDDEDLPNDIYSQR